MTLQSVLPLSVPLTSQVTGTGPVRSMTGVSCSSSSATRAARAAPSSIAASWLGAVKSKWKVWVARAVSGAHRAASNPQLG